MTDLDVTDRHPGTQHFAELFKYGHLRAGVLRDTSRRCHELAQEMIDLLPDGPELSAGLRKLLEAKDCFVRSALPLTSPAAPRGACDQDGHIGPVHRIPGSDQAERCSACGEVTGK